MRILVCIKRVALLSDDVEFTADGREVDPDYLDFALNEWDACSLEEALQLRDANGGEVIVVSVGEPSCERELRRCLAMGADRAIRVNTDSTVLDPMALAEALAEVARGEEPDLILCGVQSCDSVQGATGAALAGLLDLPAVAVVKKLEIDVTARKAVLHRELEGGLVAVYECELPAVLTIQTGINQPRYVTMRAMQEVAAAEIPVREAAIGNAGRYRIRRMFLPAAARAEMIAGKPVDIARRILEIAGQAGVR